MDIKIVTSSSYKFIKITTLLIIRHELLRALF